MKHTNNNPEDFIQSLRHVTLSKTESQAMRERLIAYADLHSVPASERVSPFSYLLRTSYMRVSVFASLVLLILVGGTGVTYAAEDSLPGQPLYVLKVSVAEPIQTALISEPSAKAKWQNTLAERRLAEASTLASKGELATSTQEYLADAIATHVALSEQASDSLAASGNDTAALDTRSDLEARLSAHANVLALMTARFDANGEASSTSNGAVLALLERLQSDRAQVVMSRVAAEVALSNSAATSTDASSTASATVVAIANEDTKRHAEESTLFRKSAVMFGLFPIAASTTASTTATSTDSTDFNEASTTEATSTESKRIQRTSPWYRLSPPYTASSTISAPHDQ